MKAINKLLNPAKDALILAEIVGEDKVVKDEGVYEGYVAGFGAMVINLDLAATVAVYEGDTKRKKVLEAMKLMLPEEFHGNESVIDKVFSLESANFKLEKRLLKQKMLNASVALKLMIRTFTIPEKK